MFTEINLSGEWGFYLDKDMSGIESALFNTYGNDTISLPSTTSIAQKGKPNPEREIDCLTDSFKFEGFAWFFKNIDLSGIPTDSYIEFFMERTRLSKVWINGSFVGECDSLCTPHIYDISAFAGENVTLAVCISNVGYPTKGGHLTSQDTQSNWNGITGEISVRVYRKIHISNIQAYPDINSKSVKLTFDLIGADKADISVWGASSDSHIVDRQYFSVAKDNPSVTVMLGEDVSLWSEHNPALYTLKIAVQGSDDISQVSFGMRSFTAQGLNFLINDNKTFLRGKHDGLIFPITGAAPTDVDEWLRILGIAKSWGINHYRFHTCCPPDSAFTAADMLGIYMQPELPFWGTITSETDENHNEAEQLFLVEEGRRMLKFYGNHPSFVMMSLGNELWGSTEKMSAILAEYHSLDNRHLYTQGSNNFQFWPNILPEDDFFSGVRLSRDRLIRGSYGMCDAPLGFVQTDEPNTVHSYDKLIIPETELESSAEGAQEIEIQYGTGVKKVKVNSAVSGLIPSKPVVTHEVGQYCVYPDFNEIEKYTGVLKARNFEIFRDRLKQKGMLHLADKFFRASGRLSAECYKLEIESAMRSQNIAGFQLLDLQDFSGQGTALVGMLDAFMDSKNLITPQHWCGFCSDAVLLAEIESFVLTSGQLFTAPVLFRYLIPEKLTDKSVLWKAVCNDEIIACGEIPVPDNFYGLGKIGEVSFTVPDFSSAVNIKLILTIDNIRPENYYTPSYSENSYSLWAYPKPCDNFEFTGKSVCSDSTVYISNDIAQVKKLLQQGEKVIYLPCELSQSIKGFYCTDFWCYPMFRTISESMNKPVAVGTLGLLIDNSHPALDGFACEEFSTPQWFHIVSHSDCAVLDDSPESFAPIVQMIDNFERNHKLGILYEASVDNGALLVCTCRISEISHRPEVQAFASSILRYAHSDNFRPENKLTLSQLGIG